MKRIDVELAEARTKIREFYLTDQYHLAAMNGIDMGEKIEVQWFFVSYATGEVTMFATLAQPSDTLPTLTDFIPSAWVSEREFTDLFGMKIENTLTGYVLEPDSPKAPLRKQQ